MSDRKSSKIQRFCEMCGKEFWTVPSRVAIGWGKYCSRVCLGYGKAVPHTIRFWDNIGEKTERGCILWAGDFYASGYGRLFSVAYRKQFRAHRVAYELMVGPVTAGLEVLHRCDNPPCINPVHLFLGTKSDNVADMMAKGRGAKGSMLPQTKLSDQDVREIRRRRNENQRVIGNEFGVSTSTINDIISERTWKHLGN